ncbi:MAG: hypothetical protein IJB57_05870 [Clostridia bacterium]|nr:hypothetical protein [Clostridia bacterium]
MKKTLIIIISLMIFITAIPVSANVCGDNHFMKYTVTKEPTYTEEGIQTGICAICGYEDIVIIPSLKRPDVTYGVYYSTLTLSNLYEIKDIFFATGEHGTYRDVKNNLIYGLTAAKLQGSTSYSYTFRTAGMHTVYIRFNDGREDMRFNINIHVTEPTFTPGNGKLTIGNIEGAKVIRVAKGVHDSVASMKASESIVNYTGRIIKSESYTLKFTENYEYYTIAVEYSTGYVSLYKYVVYGVL